MAVRSLILVLAAQALTAMPAFACGGDGGGHSGGGGFHGGGGFRGGSGFHGRDRFDRFHRLGFFGDFGFEGPVVGVGFSPFFGAPFRVPAPSLAYPYAPPLVIEPEAGVSVQQAASLTRDDVLVLLWREQWVLHIHSSAQAAGGRSRRPRWA